MICVRADRGRSPRVAEPMRVMMRPYVGSRRLWLFSVYGQRSYVSDIGGPGRRELTRRRVRLESGHPDRGFPDLNVR